MPGICVLCKDRVPSSNTCLCNLCIKNLPWIVNHCRICGAQLEKTNICPQCQKSPPHYRRCISAFDYNGDSIDKLIFPVKKNPFSPQLRQLAILLSGVIESAYKNEDRPKIVVPVPMHWRSLLSRGFNQSYSIAHQLTQYFDNLKIADALCERQNFATPQRLRNRRQRLQNMKHGFTLCQTNHHEASDMPMRHPTIHNETLAIVDDVVTTGATVDALAELLIKAGAKQVDVWAIAKTNWHI
ncbi:hypothetical protein N9M08_08505 [Porticoccaceae bacterium]|nr:hypothetical protein [Porticoccaceae bacterium]MDA8788803.1 hypothetical protein [Porticoccaceae bacterium]MDB2635496.1 hypothetical protein [Porticoccaceae bacterium]MDB2663635.1 hypothetical protein [Porticoccaceae bacterium]